MKRLDRSDWVALASLAAFAIGAVTFGGAFAVVAAVVVAVFAARLVVSEAVIRAIDRDIASHERHLARDIEQAERIALQRDQARWS